MDEKTSDEPLMLTKLEFFVLNSKNIYYPLE
jgi:hypothetical protein